MIGLDLFWGLANPFVNWMMLQPILLNRLKPNALIEEIPAFLYALIFGVFMVFASFWFHGTRHRARATIGLYTIFGAMWIGGGLIFLLTDWSREAYIVTVVAVSLIGNIFVCLGHNQDMYLMIDSMPVRRRGMTWALRQAGLGVGIFTSVIVVRALLQNVSDSPGVSISDQVWPYGWCFVMGGALYIIATWTLIPFKEAPPVDHWKSDNFWHYIRDEAKALLAKANFRWLLASNTLSGAVAFGLPAIVTIHAKEILDRPDSIVADFILVVTASQMVSGVIAGLTGDRVGYKFVGAGALVLLLGTIGVCFWADGSGDDRWLIFLAFCGMGVLLGAGPMARTQFIKELFPERDISTTLAIEHMLMTGGIILGPVVFGLLAFLLPQDGLGKNLVWLLAAVLTVASLVILVWKVEEPRHRDPQTAPAEAEMKGESPG